MPRIRPRRTLFYSIVIAGFIVLAINVHQYGSYFGGDSVPLVKLTKSNVLLDDSSPNANQKTSLEGQRRPVVDVSGGDSSVPWFMKGGSSARPSPAVVDRQTNRRRTPLFPHESDGDRIVEQLMFVPPDYNNSNNNNNNNNNKNVNGTKLKKILLYQGLQNWSPLKAGRETFLSDRCPVDTCEVTSNRDEAGSSDAVLFRDHVNFQQDQPLAGVWRPTSQVWILYLLECPYHTELFPYRNLFNWTATYRHDSDVVAPYEKFVSYSAATSTSSHTSSKPVSPRNYAANKSKKVAWFVSNCAAHNGRMEFAEQLGQHIAVDIYGACGSLQCPKTRSDKCFGLLDTQYKFYLSFENSNCKDYITEKFFVNGLGNDVLPIVMGARKEDYERAAPPHSFIYAEDFESAKDLARYLHLLDSNDTLYNEYFRWKGSGEFVNTYFWCRLCAMLHDDAHVSKVYENINAWWRAPGTCVKNRWK